MSIGCVSASDVNSDATVLNSTDSSVIAAGTGTFSDLQIKIDSAVQGSTINLDKNYAYDDGFDSDGIQINKALTIKGNDYTIDGKGLSRIFDIEASNVTLIGITLIKGYSESGNGGAILWNGDSGSIDECTLEYNAALAGGAIYWQGTNGNVDHCKFNHNNATDEYGYGGAICINGECLSITSSDFYKNYALDEGDGGALSVDADGVTVDSCNFERNYANSAGGAIYWSNDDGLLTGCTFLHDYATLGGAIVHTGFDSIVSESSFEECYALEGGAISINYCNLRIFDCIFDDNYAEYRGGAIKIDSWGAATIDYSTFTNNRVTKSSGSIGNHGGAIYSASEEGIEVRNSNFENNEVPYLGAAIYLNNDLADVIENCTFKNNTGNYGAVTTDATNVTIKDSKFMDNTGRYGAADVYLKSDDSIITNCDFKNSYASGDGGSVYWSGDSGELSDSTFTNCKVSTLNSAGAVYWSGNNGIISKSEFKNNNAFDSGAIRLYGDKVTVKDSKFINNTASLNGGAIDIDGINDNVINCQFDKNSALNGGAIKVSGDKTTIEKSTFTENNAVNGGAINWGGDDGNLINSNFVKNIATDIGGAIYWFGDDGVLKYDVFENNNTALHNDIAIEGDNVVVIPINIKINAPDVTKNYGGSESLQITLTENSQPIANAQLLININNANYTRTTDSSGKASLAINLNSGKYDAVIKYNEVSTISKITINKLSTSLTLIASQSADKTATLTATINPSDASGSVKFNINNKDYTANIINGKATTTVTNLDYNTYDVKATYDGSTNYKSSQASSKVTLKESKVIIDAPDITKYYKGPERFVVTLKGIDAKPIADGKVKITINGQVYERTTDSTGTASMAINLPAGNYKADVEYGEEKVTSSVRIKSTLEGNDLTKMFRNASQYYIKVLDSNGNPLSGQKVKFNINGVFYERDINASGIARLNINLEPKTYTITAENPSNGEMYSNTITVKPTIIENRDLTKYYRNDSQYIIKVLDDQGNPVKAGVSVEFNINGVFYTRQSDSTGHVKMNINLQPGNYVITSIYNGMMVSNNVRVLSILSGKDIVMEYKDGTRYEATLLDGQGRRYAGQTVQFNINGVLYDRETDANGVARLNINLDSGNYIITAMYNGYSTSNTITINPKMISYECGNGHKLELLSTVNVNEHSTGLVYGYEINYPDGYAQFSVESTTDTVSDYVNEFVSYGAVNLGYYNGWVLLDWGNVIRQYGVDLPNYVGYYKDGYLYGSGSDNLNILKRTIEAFK